MSGWQKLDTLSKIIAAVFIPLTIALLGNSVALANKQRDTETKFVELATAILNKDPAINPSEEHKSLRRWAVAVINRYSDVPMPVSTAEALVQTTALPQVASQVAPTPASDPSGTWGVVFGGDTTLEAARHEVTDTATRMGIGQGQVFRRQGSYRSVGVYVSRSAAEDALGRARAVRQDSYLVNMATWCPSSEQKAGYFECAPQ